MKTRYWQVTLIVYDEDMTGPTSLAKRVIEEGYRINPQPLFLKLHDVEAIEIGDKPPATQSSN